GSSSLPLSSGVGAATPSYTNGTAGVLISGPIVRDTAHFVIGLEAQRLEQPLPRPWEMDDSTDARLVSLARQTFAVDLQSYTQPRVLRTDVVSGFARVDWQLSGVHRLDVRASGANLPRMFEPTLAAPAAPAHVQQGSDIAAAAVLTSDVAPHIAHELRVAAERTLRTTEPSEPSEPTDPGTLGTTQLGVV